MDKARTWLRKFLLFSILLIATPFFIQAQSKPEKKDLADEYFKRENYAKALEYYESLEGDAQWDELIFKNYLQCLQKIKPGKVESALKRFLKRYPEEFRYQTAQIIFLKDNKKDEKEVQKFCQSRFFPWALKTSDRVKAAYNFLNDIKAPELTENLLQQGNARFGMATFWQENIKLYLAQNNVEKVSQTILNMLDEKSMPEVELQAYLQEYILENELRNTLKINLLKRIQAKPSDMIYPSFLAWIYIQEKDFDGALAQYKALDKLENNGGTRLFQLGEFAVNNGYTKIAIRSFETVIQQFPNSQYRFLAQQKMVQLKEEMVKKTYPIKTQEVKELISDYEELAQSQYLNQFDIILKISELYGRYLNKPDTAIQILEKSFSSKRWPMAQLNRGKVLMADMYILKDEPWEASLLFGQVEKDEAESPTGYEAKLKNAKVFYFKGEFELCQEQLDVLKQSTSRDISNDAIELGLLIQDLLAEDTTGFFLSKFADIDLLTYQARYEEAQSLIENMTVALSNPVVLEKLNYRLFKIYYATQKVDQALQVLDLIYKNKATDLYTDDALYYSGIIEADKLDHKEKAIEFFLKLIKETPGSVFVADARKRLRILRGDAVN